MTKISDILKVSSTPPKTLDLDDAAEKMYGQDKPLKNIPPSALKQPKSQGYNEFKNTLNNLKKGSFLGQSAMIGKGLGMMDTFNRISKGNIGLNVIEYRANKMVGGFIDGFITGFMKGSGITKAIGAIQNRMDKEKNKLIEKIFGKKKPGSSMVGVDKGVDLTPIENVDAHRITMKDLISNLNYGVNMPELGINGDYKNKVSRDDQYTDTQNKYGVMAGKAMGYWKEKDGEWLETSKIRKKDNSIPTIGDFYNEILVGTKASENSENDFEKNDGMGIIMPYLFYMEIDFNNKNSELANEFDLKKPMRLLVQECKLPNLKIDTQNVENIFGAHHIPISNTSMSEQYVTIQFLNTEFSIFENLFVKWMAEITSTEWIYPDHPFSKARIRVNMLDQKANNIIMTYVFEEAYPTIMDTPNFAQNMEESAKVRNVQLTFDWAFIEKPISKNKIGK